MNSDAVVVRNMERTDFSFVLETNEKNVEVLSPMDEEKLTQFFELAEVFLIAEVNGKQAAFVIALREGLDFYDSENYRWFRKNYNEFLYIDRVVVNEPYQGMGIGKKLYQEVFQHASLTKVPFVTAEIDTVPYNEASLKFHAALGFKEVGTQIICNNSIKVSLQEATINSGLSNSLHRTKGPPDEGALGAVSANPTNLNLTEEAEICSMK